MVWVIGIIAFVIIAGVISNASSTSKEVAEKSEFNDKKRSRAEAYSEFILREQPHERFKGMSKSEIREDVETKISEFKSAEDNAYIVPVIIWFAAAGLGILIAIGNENWFPAVLGVVGGGFFANDLGKRAVIKIEAKFKAQGYLIDKLRLK